MKRYVKRLFNGFTHWVSGLKKEERIGYILGAVIGIAMAIFLYQVIDTVPATEADYEPMERQAIAIKENQDLIFETDCNINIKDDIITIYFENDECKVIAQYTNSFDVLSISKEDKSTMSWPAVMILSIVISLIMFMGMAMIFPVYFRAFKAIGTLNKTKKNQ